MNVQLRTNVTPIQVGDDITVAFLPDGEDLALTLRYSVHLSFNGGRTFPRTLDDDVSPLGGAEWEWRNINVIGRDLMIRVTGHRINGTPFQILREDLSGSARSAAVTIPGPVTDDGVLRVEGRYDGFFPKRDNVAVNVVDHPVVPVKRPTRASVWFLGEEGTVAWLASSAPGAITSFSVELSRNNGSTWATEASNLPSTQRQIVLSVDPPIGTNSKIRVNAHWAGGQVSAQSPPFRIRVNPVDP